MSVVIWRYIESKINLTFKGGAVGPPNIMVGGDTEHTSILLVCPNLIFFHKICPEKYNVLKLLTENLQSKTGT